MKNFAIVVLIIVVAYLFVTNQRENVYRIELTQDEFILVDNLTDNIIYTESLNSNSGISNAILTDNK